MVESIDEGCSELKGVGYRYRGHVEPLNPETYVVIDAKTGTSRHRWYDIGSVAVIHHDEAWVLPHLRTLFERAVTKRIQADRPIACLLSGGLDSSLVAAVLSRELKKTGRRLKTFAIGFSETADIRYARLVARHIDSDHTEILTTEEEFLQAIPEVVRCIESYDTTSVRASVGNYLVAKAVRKLSDCKVLFNGDYSDELFMSYQYAKLAPSADAFLAENRKLMREIYLYDSLRSDRCIAGWGLEARTPFADQDLVDYVMAVHPHLKMHTPQRREKYILRKAFEGTGLLPDTVLWRPKEAFSDGVSGRERSWKDVIREHVEKLSIDTTKKYDVCQPVLPESYWYRELFTSFYGPVTPIPHFWMPNPEWVGADVVDPSARVLSVYQQS
jgi:asparagine synthase (glutamine-hydrolysing)